MTAMTEQENRSRLGRMVRETLDDVVGPTFDAFKAIRDAADATEAPDGTTDDAALGRATRAIIQEWAGHRVDQQLARQEKDR